MAAAVLAYFVTRPLPPPRILGASRITDDRYDKVGANSFNLPPPPLVTDGARVYLHETRGANSLIVEVSATGGETVALPASSALPTPFDISPARAELVVGALVAGLDEVPIQVLPLPTGSPHRLGDVLGHDATWSPDGQQITYAKGNELYVCKTDGTESKKLVAATGRVGSPRWSPDGAALRFTVTDAKTRSNSVWEVGSDGTRLHPLLPGWNNPPAECCGNWSPDGKYFVFQSTRNGKTNIWARREGKELFRRKAAAPVQLTASGMNYYSPVVSRDGKRIFVIGAAPRGEVVRYDSKSRQFVPYFSDVSAEGLDFSRDGERVTYVAFPEGTLWRSKVDGSERLQLTFSPKQAFLPRW